MSGQPASPTCSAEPGAVGRDELLAALNELLEAERAGAKVASASIKAANEDYAGLMRQVRRDEAHWCEMLDRQIRRLGGAPSPQTGAFQAKAMAIADPLARLAFLNRGQGWVLRKLDALLPRVRDDALHAELGKMLAGHRTNIELANAFQQDHCGGLEVNIFTANPK